VAIVSDDTVDNQPFSFKMPDFGQTRLLVLSGDILNTTGFPLTVSVLGDIGAAMGAARASLFLLLALLVFTIAASSNIF
jgi:hypothetical protein